MYDLQGFPEYFKVTMTDEDIEKGVMHSSEECALALAFKHDCPGQIEPGSVRVNSNLLDFSEYDFLDEGQQYSTRYEFNFDLDTDVYFHTLAFDMNKSKVKPIVLHVNITSVERDKDYPEVSIFGDISLHQDYDIKEVIVDADYFLGQMEQEWASL